MQLTQGLHRSVQQTPDEIATVFDDVADPYLRERKGDLNDGATGRIVDGAATRDGR